MRGCRMGYGARVFFLCLLCGASLLFLGRAVLLRDRGRFSSLFVIGGAFRGGKSVSITPNSHPRYYRGPAVTTHKMQFGVEFGDADYDGWFEKGLFHDTRGAYPVHIVTDAFWHCERGLHLISRDYRRTPAARNHTELRAEVRDTSSPSGWRFLELEGWYVETNYESSAVGIFRDSMGSRTECTGLNNNQPIDVRVTFAPALWEVQFFTGERVNSPNHQSLPFPPPRDATAIFALKPMIKNRGSRTPHSRFAMCAIFSFNNYMLKMWADYWSLMGVGTFYFYYNGDAADLDRLNTTLGDLKAHIVWIVWPSLHWIDTDGGDITHGQPMAITDCLSRWRDEHELFLFYDLDEFVVLPLHNGLADYIDSYSSWTKDLGPIIALRTQSAWSMLNLTIEGPNVADLNVTDWSTVAVFRGRPGGREKYWFNASAVELGGCEDGGDDGVGCPNAWPKTGTRIHNLNIHGVYRSQRRERAHVAVLGPNSVQFPAYHLHLLNTKTPERVHDGRHLFFPKDNERDMAVGDLVRRMILRRREETATERREERSRGRSDLGSEATSEATRGAEGESQYIATLVPRLTSLMSSDNDPHRGFGAIVGGGQAASSDEIAQLHAVIARLEEKVAGLTTALDTAAAAAAASAPI